MLEKIGGAAERAAAGVSRREFLGRFGGRAMGLAAAVGGLLALPGAGKPVPTPRVCTDASGHECLGLNEGDVCFAGPYKGRCTGPKVPKPKGGTTAACFCDIGDWDGRRLRRSSRSRPPVT